MHILGAMVFQPQQEADSLRRVFANPRKAFKSQTDFSDYGDFLAALGAKRAALETLGADVITLTVRKNPDFTADCWIITLQDTFPTTGCVHTCTRLWPTNLADPTSSPELLREECGLSWWFSLGESAFEAQDNRNKAPITALNTCLRIGVDPNDIIRRRRV